MTSESKKDLRKQMKSKLSALSEERIARQSNVAQNVILSLPQYENARRISVYLSMPTGEARTDEIVSDALTSGKEVFVPYIHRPHENGADKKNRSLIDMIRLYSISDLDSLSRDSWGIPTLPAGSVEARENAMGGTGLYPSENDDAKVDAEDLINPHGISPGLDMIVMPGVAFDENMNRLGHGAGFYDRFLERYCANGRRRKPVLGTFRPLGEHNTDFDLMHI